MAQTIKSYAQFNTATFEGRVFDATVVDGQYGEFLAVTIITNLVDGDDGITVTFNNSNGLLALAKKNGLPVGRMLTVCGHIASVHETYVNKDGEVVMLKRPRIHLVDASIPTGGLGATPSKKDATGGTVVVKRPAARPTQDEAPEFSNVNGF